jgi:hypothetical protein
MMTQVQQDVLMLLLPPEDLLTYLSGMDKPKTWQRWVKRIQELYAMQNPHIIGSLSDEELQGLWDMAEAADLWAVII